MSYCVKQCILDTTYLTMCFEMILFSDDVLIAYISRGLLSTLAEAKDVLTTIYDENVLTSQRVFINTYAVIDGRLLIDILPSQHTLHKILCCFVCT